MRLKAEQIEIIRKGFHEMQTRENFLELLNYTKTLVYGDKANPFKLAQLYWYANPKLNPRRYRQFSIKKKSGKERSIHAPVPGLKAIQKTLAVILQCVFEPHSAAYGFSKNRSVVQNAKNHEGMKCVYNIDLKDFFPSIDQARVWKCLQIKPFNLNTETSVSLQIFSKNELKEFFKTEFGVEELGMYKAGKGYYFGNQYSNPKQNRVQLRASSKFDGKADYFGILKPSISQFFGDSTPLNVMEVHNQIPELSRVDIASLIANLVSNVMDVERLTDGKLEKVKKSVLPQGAPTSPVLSNIVCQKLDHRLSGVAKRFGLKYSRYADDITFSSMHDVYKPSGDFIKELNRVIQDQGFNINPDKTRLQKQGYRQEVTGLTVNKKVNVHKGYIKDLRKWLYLWETYGYKKASGFFQEDYSIKKNCEKDAVPAFESVIEGKLNYLKMVKGKENLTFLKLKDRFFNLMSKHYDFEKVLKIWEEKGIEDAMQLYYENKN